VKREKPSVKFEDDLCIKLTGVVAFQPPNQLVHKGAPPKRGSFVLICPKAEIGGCPWPRNYLASGVPAR
jgi:hypothetical protein